MNALQVVFGADIANLRLWSIFLVLDAAWTIIGGSSEFGEWSRFLGSEVMLLLNWNGVLGFPSPIHKISIFLHCQLLVVVYWGLDKLIAADLLLFLFERLDDFVVQDLFYGQSFLRIKSHHFLKKISEHGREIFEIFLGLGWHKIRQFGLF